MRLHRFYIKEKIGNNTEMRVHSVELSNQVRKVFRLKLGDLVVLFDGSGFDYESAIEDYGKDFVVFSVRSVGRSRFVPQREVYLCAGVVKKDTFEWIVEKATELGVTHIVPVMAERSEKKSLNMGRLEKIAIEASEQSGRGNVPEVLSIMSLEETIGYLREKSVVAGTHTSQKLEVTFCDFKFVVFHTEGELINMAKIREQQANNQSTGCSLAIFIGPEGGWSPAEIDMFHKNREGVKTGIYSLGDQVLRAETAVVAALSLLMLGE